MRISLIRAKVAPATRVTRVDKIAFHTAEGLVFDIDFGLTGATFAQRVETAREALEHLLWQFASAMDEPDLPDAA